MSLITRCPVCATMFKVVPDQLRISAGWVRCGVCEEVFDASEQMLLASESNGLHAVASAPAPIVPVSLPESAAESEQRSAEESTSHDHGPELRRQSDELSELAKENGQQAPPVVDSLADAPAEKTMVHQADDLAPPRANALFARLANLNEPARAPAQDPVRRSSEHAALPDSTPAPVPEEPALAGKHRVDVPESESWLDELVEDASADNESLEPAEEVPSFVRQAQRQAFWRSPGVRIALWLAVALVALGLGWQWAVNQRDWLAAREPRLTPLLEFLCQPSGCDIAPYRDLKVIVIDGSSFQRVSADSFQLSFGLRNNGDLPVATPSLQLTLTDAQNQALLHRVLKAQDLSAPSTLAAQGEFNGISALSVDVPDPAAIVGYRLVAFYP